MGMLMARYGLPRIGGRIMGLLMVDDKPLSLDDIAGLLSVSRASVSTNLRMTEMSGMALRVSRPGDRRDYYVGVEDVWARGLKTSKTDAMIVMREAARKALPSVPPDDIVARARLQEIIDFCEFFNERLEQLMEDWQAYKAKIYGK
jgi:DNA-binding transcriptional regulator GbsR (MarR family)